MLVRESFHGGEISFNGKYNKLIYLHLLRKFQIYKEIEEVRERERERDCLLKTECDLEDHSISW